tara:strand:+ start:165 stop:371 length:207 start_codon:yes stop_codon:yes gene_type:complete
VLQKRRLARGDITLYAKDVHHVFVEQPTSTKTEDNKIIFYFLNERLEGDWLTGRAARDPKIESGLEAS